MAGATICTNCGAKFLASRTKCPRCRTVVVVTDPVAAAAAAAASSRKLQKITAGMAAGFLIVLAVLWLRQERAPAPDSQTAQVSDPLATRRSSKAAAPAPPDAPVADTRPAAERPFIEAAGTGWAAYSSGDLASAMAAYSAAVDKNPQDAESWSNLGQVLVKMNRTTEALPCFDRAIALIPERWAYRFNRGRAYSLMNKLDEAIADYREAQRLFPGDYATTFNLALALHKKGDEVSAVKAYQEAIALAPGDASFRMALGISLERLGKKSEAADAYKEYLRLSPKAADAETVKARIAQLTGTSSTAVGS